MSTNRELRVPSERARIIYGAIILVIVAYVFISAEFVDNDGVYGCYSRGSQTVKVGQEVVTIHGVVVSGTPFAANIKKIDRVRGYLIYVNLEPVFDSQSKIMHFVPTHDGRASSIFVRQQFWQKQDMLLGEPKVSLPKTPCRVDYK